MDRDQLVLYTHIKKLLEVYTFEEILEYNDDTVEDILMYLFYEYGLKFPEVEPV